MSNLAIKTGYNQAAFAYNQDRNQLKTHRYLVRLLQLLPVGSEILDLGCGSGIPIDQELLKKGYLVTGLDISETQISLARKNCPTGNFLLQDIGNLKPYEYQVDAIVSFYALFHLPRKEHEKILHIWSSFLPVNGYLLITMGDRDFEGWHDFYGVRMWSSHFGPEKNKQLVMAAGFKILFDDMDTSGQEKHQIILAQKI